MSKTLKQLARAQSWSAQELADYLGVCNGVIDFVQRCEAGDCSLSVEPDRSLRELREAAGLSQQKVADRWGISRGMVGHMERDGEFRKTKGWMYADLAGAGNE